MQIEMKGIDKSFGTNQVLKDAGFLPHVREQNRHPSNPSERIRC